MASRSTASSRTRITPAPTSATSITISVAQTSATRAEVLTLPAALGFGDVPGTSDSTLRFMFRVPLGGLSARPDGVAARAPAVTSREVATVSFLPRLDLAAQAVDAEAPTSREHP